MTRRTDAGCGGGTGFHCPALTHADILYIDHGLSVAVYSSTCYMEVQVLEATYGKNLQATSSASSY